MRNKMPTVAAWIDELRHEFGADGINAQIRRGMNGEQAFHATENGHSVGTPFKPYVGVTPTKPWRVKE